MKPCIACCALLVLAACGSSSPNPTGTTGTEAKQTNGGTSTSTSGATATGGGSTTGSGGTAGGTLGAPCTVSSTANSDPCAANGYECSTQITGADAGTCVLPEEYYDCLSAIGCQDGGSPELICSPGFHTAQGQSADACVYPCKSSSDCTSSYAICTADRGVAQHFCYTNYCDLRQPGTFQTCPALAANDGECLSFNSNNYDLCIQTGSLPVYSPCDGLIRGLASTLCAYKDLCISNQAGDGGLCMPLTVDGGCPAGSDAVQTSAGSDWKTCAVDCTASHTCLVGSCQVSGSVSVCLP